MAKRPKELFNPGELAKTRKNIGNLSSEEAKRMAEILGGEVGIERTDDVINRRYKKLAEQTRRKHDSRFIYHKTTGNNILQTEDRSDQTIKTKPIEKVRQSYIEKIRMSFIAYNSEYRIKTFFDTIGSFLNFLPGYKNRINPAFIRSFNALVFNHIEQLVISSRILYSGIENKDIFSRKDPYLWSIIRTIIDWNIEAIEQETARLKSFSNSVTVEACTNLIRNIYIPLILLSKVPPEQDIKRALEYLYNHGVADLPKKHVKITKLRKRYIIALEEVIPIFNRIKYNLYPLMLMQISPRAYSYRDMLKNIGKTILTFLELNSDDLIIYKEPKNRVSVEEPVENEAPPEEDLQSVNKKPPIDIGIAQGLFFLENLFPGSGWLKLNNNPDMFPYFQPVLDFPADMALIAPDDILQKVIILTAVLKELFFGFRSIEYGFIRDERGTAIDLKDLMDEITDKWYHFLTTLIEKNYITSLIEYCRQLERDNTFPESDYGRRIEADILWLRKKFIFPHLYLDTPKIMRPRINLSIPKLYKKTEDLKNILERMVLEIWNNEGIPIETLTNPDRESLFEVDSTVSKKLKNYFKKKNKPLSNKNLILSTLQIVLVLDYLLNDKESPAYISPPLNLFRSEGNLGIIPVYSTHLVLSPGVQADWKTEDIDPEKETEEIDMLSGFPGSKTLYSYLEQYIRIAAENEEPFTLIRIESRDYNLAQTEKSRLSIIQNMTSVISDSIRQFEDIPLRISADRMYIILPDTELAGSLKLVERIYGKTGETLPCFAGIAEYKHPMSAEEILKAAEEALGASKAFPAPMLSYFNHDTGEFDHTL